MEKKKPTNAQLQKRLDRAVVHVDMTKNVRSIFFGDKGLRLTDADEVVLVQTAFHTHIFQKATSSGYSRPALYVARIIDIALSNKEYESVSKAEYGYSYSKLFEILKKQEDKTEYNICRYVDWWLFNIFQPLYQIDENAASQFMTYYNYMSNVAANTVILEEHKEGLTNKQFVEQRNKLVGEFLKNVTETTILEPMSDEQLAKENMEAMQEEEIEQKLKEN